MLTVGTQNDPGSYDLEVSSLAIELSLNMVLRSQCIVTS